jgi:Ca2+-binding RTX toxin-like protein
LSGGDGNDVIRSRGGDDSASGGLGDDDLTGGPGRDSTGFGGDGGGVVVDRRAGTADGAFGEHDTFRGFEEAWGSDYDDTFIGPFAYVFGDDGDDTIRHARSAEGYRGNDLIIGAPKADHLDGNDGDDVIRGRAGDDALDGFEGVDVGVGGPGMDTCTNIEEPVDCELGW